MNIFFWFKTELSRRYQMSKIYGILWSGLLIEYMPYWTTNATPFNIVRSMQIEITKKIL